MPNFVKIRCKMTDFLLIYHKNVKFWGVLPPLWRHKMPVFCSKFQKKFLHLCSNFLPNFVKIKQKIIEFLEIFDEISNFEVSDPPLWRHKGVNFRQKSEFVKFTYFPTNFEKKSKIEAIFLKKVHFRDFDPPLWRHRGVKKIWKF